MKRISYTALDGDSNVLHGLRLSLDELPATSDTVGLALQLLQECQDYIWERGRWREFDSVFEKASEIAGIRRDMEQAASFLAYRAGLRQAFGDWPAAVSLAEQSLRASQARVPKARALFHLGAAAYDLAWYRRARRALEAALELTEDARWRAQVEHKLFRVYRWYGNTLAADAALHNAIAWSEGTPEDDTDARQRRWLRAELLLDRVAATSQADSETALQMIDKSRQIYTDEHFQRGLAYADLASARVELQRGQLEAARRALAYARGRLEQEQYFPGLAHVHFAIGMVERAAGRQTYGRALEAFDQSLRYAQDVGYDRAALRAAAVACGTAFRIARWSKVTVYSFVLLRTVLRSIRRRLTVATIDRVVLGLNKAAAS